MISLDQKILQARKMLPELDPVDVEDTILEMRFLPDGAAVVLKETKKRNDSKEVKDTLRRYERALKGMRKARNSLREHSSFSTFIAFTAKSDFDEMVERDLAVVKRLIAERRPQRPSRFESWGRVAAKTARNLLVRAGHRIVVKSGSEWCKLAAILYGDPKKNMYSSVRDVHKKSQGN